MSGKSPEQSQEDQEKAMMIAADSLAGELGINTLIIQACGRERIGFLIYSRNISRHIWLSRTPELLPILENDSNAIITVPHIAKGENFLALGYFLAVIGGKLEFHQPVINLTAGNGGVIDGLHITTPARRLPWLNEEHITSFRQMASPQTLLMLISIAMRFAREGREGKSIGTCFILSRPEEVAPFTWQLIFNPCAGYPAHIRNIFHEDFLETMRELSSLDGAFLIGTDGEVHASAVFIATQGRVEVLENGRGARHHSACALTSHTQATAVVLSESSGEITVYHGGKLLLRFA